MPHLILNDGDPPRTFQLRTGENTLGRREENDIAIPDASISGKHCVLLVSDSSIRIQDLGSTNGTFVDGVQITEGTLLPGGRLKVGKVELTLSGEDKASGKAPVPTSRPATAPAVRVVTRSGSPAPSVHLAAANIPVPPRVRPAAPAADAIPMPPPPTAVSAVQEGHSGIIQPPVAFEPAGNNKCKTHTRTSARFRCPQCNHYFCELCVNARSGQGDAKRYCRACASECIPLKVEGPKTAAPKSFYSRVPGAFLYPFRGNGVLLLIGVTILFAVLRFLTLGIIGILMMIVATGYLFSFMQTIIHSTVAGDETMPDMPGLDELGSACWAMVGTVLISFWPAILLGILSEWFDMPIPDWVIDAALALGALYFPMAFLAVAMKDTVLAANPLVVLPAIFKMPFAYLTAAIILAIVFAGRSFGDWVMERLGEQVFKTRSVGEMVTIIGLRMVWSLIGMYLLTVSMRILGLLYVSYKTRLGWFAR